MLMALIERDLYDFKAHLIKLVCRLFCGQIRRLITPEVPLLPVVYERFNRRVTCPQTLP